MYKIEFLLNNKMRSNKTGNVQTELETFRYSGKQREKAENTEGLCFNVSSSTYIHDTFLMHGHMVITH